MSPKPRLVEIGSLVDAGAIIEIKDGNHGEKHPKATDYVDEGIPFIMANNVGKGTLHLDEVNKISQQQADKLDKGFSIEGDVLLTHKGTVGNTAIVPAVQPYVMLTPQVTYYRVNPEHLSNSYLMYAFQEPMFQKRLKSLAVQATRPYISITAQRELKILMHPHSVQTAIVRLLKPYDDLIENNRRRIQLLEQAARLLYKEWFVHLRFPGHEHVKIKDGVPEGWEKKTAFDVMEVLSGGTPKTKVPEYWDGSIPFFTPKDAVNYAYVFGTEKTITEEGLRNCNSRLYPKDSVFITARGTVGKINLAQTAMAMNQSCYALVARPPFNQHYLYFALVDAVEQFRSRAVGAVFDAIIRDTFKLIPFVVPDEKLIAMFNEYASQILRQIDNLSTQNRKLAHARDLLLPRLMNGEVLI